MHISTKTKIDVAYVDKIDASFANIEHPCYATTRNNGGDTATSSSCTLSVWTPATFAAGSWTVTVASTKGVEVTCDSTIAILFNPWCTDDDCYMADEAEKNRIR